MRQWDLRAAGPVSTFECGAQAYAVDYSSRATNAGVIAVGLHNGVVQLWDARRGSKSALAEYVDYLMPQVLLWSPQA